MSSSQFPPTDAAHNAARENSRPSNKLTNERNLDMLARSTTLGDTRRIYSASSTPNDLPRMPNVESNRAPHAHQERHINQAPASMHTRSIPPTRIPSFYELTRFAPEARKDMNTQRPGHAQDQSSQGQVRLSVYESPRATYTWPRFDPTSTLSTDDKPVIYVTYKRSSDTPHSEERPSTSSSSEAELSEPASLYAEDPHTYGRKRSSSIESEWSSNDPINVTLKQPKTSYFPRPRHDIDLPPRATCLSPAVFNTFGASPDGRDLHTSFQGLGIRNKAQLTSSSPGGARPPAETKSHIVHPHVAAGPAKQKVDRRALATRANRQPESDDEWLQYTEPYNAGGVNKLRCTWGTRQEDGSYVRCTYIQKRHLVKRHVCSKHLGIRPWDCPMCDKSFAQLSNLETHINTHTGDRPHECPYCDERFKDPARCCRHKRDVHGYITARERKRDGYGASDLEFTDSEYGGTDLELAQSGPVHRVAAPLRSRRRRRTEGH
ncbi:uncharacterized protein C8Q71DRAFT_731649 [Rhodofomes roseus]|uniref:C2H2-type domain-containing protein n=1 Tax=Rhodofomes roseus TaxID=34475 RepID=A0ABQ8KY08_9APHY|nr:uncharacterized protein C8Q71DRAFT_731649 [Rhodofomes roseus]KAH9844182.1 hypothetical protein C8Q71DRAFT_731649 [Rhodofomes roseus]